MKRVVIFQGSTSPTQESDFGGQDYPSDEEYCPAGRGHERSGPPRRLERAPAALRAAGIAERLKAAGFHVTDHGDTSTYVSQPDDEHPRARNVSAVLKMLNDLRPRVEVGVKSGALPVILSGDCISVLAVIAGTRRYYRNVSLIYVDRDADLNVPATTPSGMRRRHGDFASHRTRRAGTGALLGRAAAGPRT